MSDPEQWIDRAAEAGHDAMFEGSLPDGIERELWRKVAHAVLTAARDAEDEDEGHGPWFHTEYGTLCACRFPVDENERCTRPRHRLAERDALLGAVFEAADELMGRFDREPDQVDIDDPCVDDLRAAFAAVSAWNETNDVNPPDQHELRQARAERRRQAAAGGAS